jgi:outer membrane protein
VDIYGEQRGQEMRFPRGQITYWMLSSLLVFSSLEGEEVIGLSLREVIYQTLMTQWNIETSELNIDTQDALLEQAKGAFNPLLNTDFARTFMKDIQGPLGQKTNESGRTTTSSLSVDTLTRLGTSYGITYNNANVVNPVTPPKTDSSNVGLTVNQPLLRNLLYSPQTTLELTRKLQVKAAKLQNVQNVAQAVLTSVNAYWEFVAAKRLLQLQREQEERLLKLEQYAKALVDEQQEGFATLYQPRADYEAAVANRIQAEQDLKSTYNALLLAMGLVPDDACEIPEVITEYFPFSNVLCPLSEKWYDTYVDKLCENRADLIAAQVLIDIAKLNLRSAKNALLPELDLIGGAALQNTGAGSRGDLFESSSFSRPQKNYTVGVSFSFPIFNDFAKGLVRQQRAAKAQAIVNASQLQSQITSSFKTAYTLYNALFEEIKKLKISSEQYQESVESEVLKLQEGLSDYFVVLQMQTNWQQILIQELIVEKLFAQNITQIKLLAGRLVTWDHLHREVESDDVLMSMEMFLEPPCPIIQEKLEIEDEFPGE